MHQKIVIKYDQVFNVTELDFGSIKNSTERLKIISCALSYFSQPINTKKKKHIQHSDYHNTITIEIENGNIQKIYGDPKIWNNFLVLTKVDLKLSGHKG